VNQEPVRAPVTRAGRMTAVMRAASAPAHVKALRVGLLEAGKVLDERLFRSRMRVTVGTSARATFVISNGPLERLTVLEWSRGRAWLCLDAAVSGRVALDGGAVATVDELRARSGGPRTARRIELTGTARGKLTIGGTTLLFQLADVAPPAPKARLPLAVRAGLASQIDWRLTIIAALSFLAHFGFIGSMYSDWSDPIVDEHITVPTLVDLSPSTSAPPPETEHAAPDSNEAPPRAPDAAREEKPAGGSNDRSPSGRAPSTDPGGALAERAEALRMQALVTMVGDTALRAALDRDVVPPTLLDEQARANIGSQAMTSGLHLAPAGKLVTPGRVSDLARVGITRDDTQHGTQQERSVAPALQVDVAPLLTRGPLANPEGVIAKLRPAFRKCYVTGLNNEDPNMAGSLTVRAKVRPNGEVESADAMSVVGLSPAVAQCVARRVSVAQFVAEGASAATIDIPVKFYPQH
jgi:hypothetical protein